MALVFKRTTLGEHRIGIWEITEEPIALLSCLDLDADDLSTYNCFKHDSRKKEWLATRLLIKELAGGEKKIVYNEDSKPFLADESFKLSISHSKGMAAVILGKKNEVGIDLELLSDRIERIVHKFMSEKELAAIDPNNRFLHLYLHWSAKETLTKIFGKKDLIFDEQLILEAFIPNNEGQFKAMLKTSELEEEYLMNYFKFKDYVVVWTCK